MNAAMLAAPRRVRAAIARTRKELEAVGRKAAKRSE